MESDDSSASSAIQLIKAPDASLQKTSLGGLGTESTSSIVKHISSDETVENDESLPAICPLFAHAAHQRDSYIPRGHLSAEKESLGSYTEAEQSAPATANVDVPKKWRKPVMKSGWMHLEDVIPKFEIDDETFNNIIFRETLLVSMLEGRTSYPTPVGALSLDIQRARGGPLRYNDKKRRSDYIYPKFLVHLSTQLDFNGHNGGSKIVAWVDRDLQTLEESRKEFLVLEDGKVSKQSLYVNAQDSFYYMRHNKHHDKYCSPKRAKNLICEGSDFILMRYLATKRFIGSFEVCTLYINGDLCRSIYSSKGPQSGMIYNKKLDVCKIYRTIIEECGIEHRSITLMTLDGRLLKQEWFNSHYILQINPLMEVNSKPSPNERVPLEQHFETDLQLLSLYLDAKTVNKKRIDTYMHDHPEISNLLADYVQTILQLKPENVFEFTAKYFLSFSPQLLPFTEYFEPPPGYGQNDDDDFWRYL